MRALIQRVSHASVEIDGVVKGAIQRGLLVLAGVASGDTPADIDWLARKIACLRIFNDEAGVMNRSVIETGGRILAISQFTLCASTRKGNRPSYSNAADPVVARPLFDQLVAALALHLGHAVPTGEFGADMAVVSCNDGPVTIWLDSRTRE